MSIPGVRRYRSGLSDLIAALSSARTTAEVADAVWLHRDEACGAVAIGFGVTDPDVGLLCGTHAPPLVLDPLLIAEFAYAQAPLFYGSGRALAQTYPVLRTVGAPVPDAACAVLPLSGAGLPPGSLVAVWDRPRSFSPGDRGLLTALAALCSAELVRTWPADRERDAVERLRSRLRPPWLPHVPGAEVAVRHQPAAGAGSGVGFYDLFATDDGVWRLVAVDVAARGVDAAVLAGLARQAFRNGGGVAGPAAALGRLDVMVRDFGDPGRRMSAACVDLSRRGRGFTLTAARAGHPPPVVLRASGAVLSLDVPGGPLGEWPDPEPVELGLELQPGDGLLLCAGGRARGGLIGDPRFGALLAGCAGWSAEAVLDRVGVALSEPGVPAADGASFLALRVRGGRTRTPTGAWPVPD
jgi:hypothetical protein